MLTLYHSPMSRSSRILWLIDEMGIADKISVKPVTIRRFDGSGHRDGANPHPEGKVPVLFHDDTMITETGAIMLYLTAAFADHGLSPKPGTAKRGEYLTWLFWYGSVMEPVLTLAAAGIDHPYMVAGIRGVAEVNARLHAALAKGPWLLGEEFSAADLLVHSPYGWFKEATPTDPLIADWVARCQARPSVMRTRQADVVMMAAMAQAA
ncbi:MAG: glutathione S-transferase family protein [bacterium]